MEHSCIRQTSLPNTTKLFADFLYHPDGVRPFFPYPRRDAAAFADAARAIDFPDQRRVALVEALRGQIGDHPLLEVLARPGTVAVVTGQQVGLFSGPAYTVYKALTAIRLAQRLSEQGIRAVPIFWLATEDHDLAEVHHAWFFDSQHRPVRIDAELEASPEQPVGGAVIRDAHLEEAAAALRDLPFGDEALRLLREAYAPGRNLGQAFGALLQALVGKYGMLQLDPMCPEIRAIAAPLLNRAAGMGAELNAALLERNQELVAAGYHAQVYVEPQTSLVFLLQGGRRIALRRHGDEYIAGALRIPAAELAQRGAELSPNALLRPVMQDFLLPTVAYVGGPAEIAYLAQSQVLYQRLLGRQPVAFPRATFTLFGARSRKLLDRYHLDITDFFDGDDELKQKMARVLVPASVQASVERSKSEVRAAAERLERELVAFSPSLAKAIGTSRRKIEYQVSKIERKVGRETMARDERASQDADWLQRLLFPRKHLQERLISFVPFYAKHGPALIDTLHDAIELDCSDHRLLEVA